MKPNTRMRWLVAIAGVSLLGTVAASAINRPESAAEEQGKRACRYVALKYDDTGPIELPPPIRYHPLSDLVGGGGNRNGPDTFSMSAVPLASMGASGGSATDRIDASLRKAAEKLD